MTVPGGSGPGVRNRSQAASGTRGPTSRFIRTGAHAQVDESAPGDLPRLTALPSRYSERLEPRIERLLGILDHRYSAYP